MVHSIPATIKKTVRPKENEDVMMLILPVSMDMQFFFVSC